MDPEMSMPPGGRPRKALPEFAVEPRTSAFLIVDVQYLDAHPEFGLGKRATQEGTSQHYAYFFRTIGEIIPRIQHLQRVCRERGVEVIFTVIASHVKDCRDVSLEHKRLELLAPAGSKEAQILDEIAPRENELVLPKGCSGVFNGTPIDQILKNMGIETLIVGGVATNYCVETAVRDAADRGFSVILLSDACAAFAPEDHAFALRILNNSYCKVMTVQDVIDRLTRRPATRRSAPAGSEVGMSR